MWWRTARGFPEGDSVAAEARLLAVLMLAGFAASLSMTVVAVAVPAIAREFALGQHQVHWAFTAFVVAMTVAMLPMPWLLGRLGARRLFVGALALLLLGGTAGALAPGFGWLVAARMAEGVAAGLLQPLPVILVSRRVTASRRGRAMGFVTLGLVLAPAVAPLIGGLLVQGLGWRAVLLATGPLGLLAMVAGWRSLPAAEHAPGGVAPGAASWMAVLRAHRHLPRSLGVAFLYGAVMFGITYLVPVFLQQALGRTPAEAGSLLLPSGLALAAFSPWAGRLADRHAPARLIACGMALLGGALLAMLGVGQGTAAPPIVLLLVLGRLGMGLVLPSIGLGALGGLPAGHAAPAAAMVNVARQFGAALGVAGLAPFLQWRLQAEGSGGAGALLAFHQTFALMAAVCALGAWGSWRAGGSTRTTG